MSGSTDSQNVIPRTQWPGQISDCLLLTSDTTTQRPGAAIQITVSGVGTVTLTLWGGHTIVVNPQVGDSIYPYQVTKYTTGTAQGVVCYNLFL